MAIDETHLIWTDLEMTGLEPASDVIIEIATVVTDAEVMGAMDEWNTRQHGQSGLTDRVLSSTVNTRQAEQETLQFLKQWVPKGKSPMCGNSICQDRRFMARLMPELEAYFLYRNLDVSTLKELARRWRPELIKGFTKKGSHLAMDDILDSIAELKYYRTHFIQG